MWCSRKGRAAIVALVFVACSKADDDAGAMAGSAAEVATGAGAGAAVAPSAGGDAAPVAGGVAAGTGGAGGPPQAGGGGLPATGGAGAATDGGGAVATEPDAGAATDAGLMGVPDAGAAPGMPKIPEPPETCVELVSGVATIGGLRVQIEAGMPGATQGALLFAWHFTAGTAGAAMSAVPSSVRSEITSGGGVVVAPQGNVAGAGRTDIAPPTSAWFIEDLEVADEIVACGVANHNIDPKRIYATGCSAGGLMSGTFGLMRSEYVAAVAPNSGGINFQGSRMLSDTSHGPAAFLMHGGAIDNVIVNFGDTSHWFEDQNRMAANHPFMIECNHGIGHCGAPSSLHVLAWEFMKAHPYDVGESPWKSAPPADLPSYCVDATDATP